MTDPILTTVASMYQNGYLTKEISRKLGISEHKVRKLLATSGIYTSATGKKIAELQQQGKTINEIAIELGLSRSNVLKYTAYSKGIYNSSNPSPTALKVRKCRAKKRRQQSE